MFRPKELKKWIHQRSWVLLVAFCIVGLFYPFIGGLALVCMLAPVVVAFFKGRIWCGNFCPRGSFNDIILARFSTKRKIPAFLRETWFRILVLIGVMSAFIFQLTLAWGNFLSVGRVFVRMIIITTLITIILGLIYKPRTWCTFCPMGTMAYFVSKLKNLKLHIKHIQFNKNDCISCNRCTKNCPINIDVLSYKDEGVISDPNCLKCGVCIAKCPKKALS